MESQLPLPQLNAYEMGIVQDQDFLKAKQHVVAAVADYFGRLSAQYNHILSTAAFELRAISPKVSKGENYRQLPYVVLDYPRVFGAEDVFAVRSLFWWGNFFSITLQLSGEYLQRYQGNLQQALERGMLTDWFISSGNDPWQHHFEGENYLPVTGNEQLADRPFLKLAKKIPLTQWDVLSDFFLENFGEIMRLLRYQAPMR